MNIFRYLNAKGAKIPNHKELTKDLKVEVLEPPKYLYYPMAMHIGKPSRPAVRVGDKVKIGTLLGEIEEGLSANIHSSVSGQVVSIGEDEAFRGKGKSIVVENDFMDEKKKLEPLSETITPEEFAKRLEEAGITGKGGAGFPAHIKYDMEKHETEYLVINGAECEPYSTTDHRAMVEYADEIIEITSLIMKIYHIDESYIAIEDNMKESKEALDKAIIKKDAKNIKVHELPAVYPQGHSALQIEQVLGIEIKEGERSGDVGVLQSNVSTIKAIYDAVFKDDPLYKRIITVTGPMIKNPKNLMVRIGTKVEDIVEKCGGFNEGERLNISGGPMMGKSFDDLSLPVDKDTTTLLFLKKHLIEEEKPCIRCAKCILHCPVSIQPIRISNAYREREYHLGKPLKSESCINCGTCSYICPSKINLLDDIQKLNKELEEKDDE
ncbi:electron transport complex protein RnfC [Acetoanaerobium pronyense]|uniref:Ion-translocating oxidoreductase complex subunit C n=1 Tax=Acetoanaerobium pronyense TaxID=1482736 RepID=A0ABS4KH38_9FIRM|nr:electron transport complex subunit RsxC [Acetoanaerobium pronyense]MBP2027102.1 electron transport complex protein RnfC [Acetoanaerobium pronyense]